MATAVCPDITGSIGVVATFDGSSSVGATYYRRRWIALPATSSVANQSFPFPDNQGTTPVNMTDNEGLWHFENPSPLADSSGNGNTATNNGATQVAGKVGSNAYEFGASDDLGFGTASNFLAAASNFSFSMWVKCAAAWSPNQYDPIFGFGDNFDWFTGLGLYFTGTGNSDLRFWIGAYNVTYIEFELTNKTDWNHLMFTYDGSTVRAYLNGTEMGTTGYASSLTGLTETLYLNKIGTHSPSSAGYGLIADEFAVWSRQLSAAEIAQIYFLQAGNAAGVGSTLGFTPDVNGAYTIQLDVGGDTTNANCVVSASTSASSSFTFQGYNFQGVTPCF